MGLFLSMPIVPNLILKEDWEKTYEQAVQIADKCNLLDKVVVEHNGYKYAFARKTRERDLYGNGEGISACGTMDSGYNMEEFPLYRDLDYYRQKRNTPDDGTDVLLTDGNLQAIGVSYPSGVYDVWGGKTQGQAGHLPLLAIACLFADRFPEAVSVGGDITAGQCKMALQIVKECLGIEIQLPVRCRADVLARRMKAVNIPVLKQLTAFFELYLGALTPEIGETLHSVFSDDIIYEYFCKEFVENQSSNLHFSHALRDYLMLGHGISDLLKMLISDENGCKMTLEDVLKKLFSYKIHIPFDEKECVDLIPSNAVSGDIMTEPSFDSFLGGMLLSVIAGRNTNIPVYVPLELIRERCRAFDQNSDALIDRLLSEMKPNELQEKVFGTDDNSLMGMMRQKAKKIEEKEKSKEGKYDINRLEDMFCYYDGCTFNPALEKGLLKSLQKIQTFDIEEEFEAFSKEDREVRETWFIRRNRYVLFRESLWEHIFEHIMEDDYIRRYFALFCADCSSKSASDLIEPLMSHWKLFDLLWDKAEKLAEQDV